MFSSSAFGATQFEGTAPAMEAASRKPRQEERQTCLPVTVRSIQCAVEQREDGGGELRFHGAEAGMLVLVGLVEAMTRQAASVELSLSDGTGRMKARHYVTNNNQSSELDELAPGCYVTVYGSVRTAPEVHFAAMGVSLVKSADEVSYHMIEAAYAALKLQKGHAEPTTPAPKKALAEATLSPQKLEIAAAPAAVETAQAPKGPLGGSALRKAVLKCLQKEAEGRPEGVSAAAVCGHCGSTPAADVSAALQKLVDAGEIYTTIDDDHFLCL